MKYSSNRRELAIDAGVLMLYLLASAYVFSILVSLRPNAGSWYLLPYFYLLPGIFNRMFRLINRFYLKKHERRYRWSFSLLSVVVGSLLTGNISSLASDIAMDRFERAYQAVADALHANEIRACEKPGDEVDIPDAIRPAIKGPETIWIHYLESGFVISTRGGAIDIDGSTIYYDSTKKQWDLFHNDNQAKAESYHLVIEDSRRCKFPLA